MTHGKSLSIPGLKLIKNLRPDGLAMFTKATYSFKYIPSFLFSPTHFHWQRYDTSVFRINEDQTQWVHAQFKDSFYRMVYSCQVLLRKTLA